jgi:antitoxin component YwqK of YwqJK toxin-antitoxin module
MKFGLQAEEWMIFILRNNGFSVEKATYKEDHIFKVDFWVLYNREWIPVQFSVNKMAILNEKGKDSIRRGIVPMWIDGDELQIAFQHKDGTKLVQKFWSRTRKILKSCAIKRFRKPHWAYA